MAGAGADAPVSPQRAPATAAAPRSASGLSSLAALNERKRKEVSPVKGAEATVCLPKRLRHPLAEASTTAVPAVLAAGASAEWKLYTEQVTPANGPPASPDQPRPHLGGGILPGQFEGDAATAVDAESITEEELVEAITAILENICAINNGRIAVPSNLGGTRAPYRSATYPDGSSSIFFSLQKPAVEMRYYVARLVKYMHVSTSVFVVALIYLDRVHAADEILALTDLNVHRLITTALAVATKWCEDEVHRNSTVCRIGGVPSTSEMNLLGWLWRCDSALPLLRLPLCCSAGVLTSSLLACAPCPPQRDSFCAASSGTAGSALRTTSSIARTCSSVSARCRWPPAPARAASRPRRGKSGVTGRVCPRTTSRRACSSRRTLRSRSAAMSPREAAARIRWCRTSASLPDDSPPAAVPCHMYVHSVAGDRAASLSRPRRERRRNSNCTSKGRLCAPRRRLARTTRTPRTPARAARTCARRVACHRAPLALRERPNFTNTSPGGGQSSPPTRRGRSYLSGSSGGAGWDRPR